MTYNEFYEKWYGNYVDLDKSWGCQCWDGAINLLHELYGVTINCTWHGFACDVWEQRKTNGILYYCNEYPRNKAKQGDIIVFKAIGNTPDSHIGIIHKIDGGSVYVFGTNQGGYNGTYNVVVLPLNTAFETVFRPKCWDVPQPKPLKWKKEGIALYGVKEGKPVYRLYNKYLIEHLYTMSKEEYDHLVSLGWDGEGIAWNSPTEGKEVYRLYNPNNGFHLYTLDTDEVNKLIPLGWKLEHVEFKSDENKEIPIYRAYLDGNGNHFLTSDKKEYEGL